MAISRRLRFEILRRDGHTCRYCGASAPDVALTVDHVIPTALGGSDDPSNLVTACADCNAGKSSTAPDAELVEQINTDAARLTAALEVAHAEDRSSLAQVRYTYERFSALWHSNCVYDSECLDPGWERKLDHFMARGLTIEDFEHFIRVAFAADLTPRSRRFAYFYGCCRNAAERREQRAREILDEQRQAAQATAWTAEVEAFANTMRIDGGDD